MQYEYHFQKVKYCFRCVNLPLSDVYVGPFLDQVTQVPYMVTLNQAMYVQVNLRRDDKGLVLFLDTCVASPSPHDFQNNTYDLVRNGYALSQEIIV